MLMIRLQRVGKRNQPHFRFVLTDKRNAPQAGRFLEILGSYNPRSKDIQLKEERIKYWIGVGAQLSDTAHNMFVNAKIVDAPKRKMHIPAKVEEKTPSDAGAMEGKEETTEGKAEDVKTETPAEVPAK